VGLERLKQGNEFRSDLLGRLEGVVVEVPPLRDRRDDILPLFTAFVREQGIEKFELEPDALEALLIAPWPRNVRELKAFAQRWVQVLLPGRPEAGETPVLKLEDLPEELTLPVRYRRKAALPPALELVARPSREELLHALDLHDGSIKKVADEYGKDRKQVYRWIELYGIKRELDEES
jgi:two-component system C4-dicarboxylate transport response regulator DctD